MKKASITDTKNQLSALLDEVRRGESILILDRGKPVARLVPSAGASEKPSEDGRLENLERAGLVVRSETHLGREWFQEPPIVLPGKQSVLKALLEEREETP